jgi:hypothetical protein
MAPRGAGTKILQVMGSSNTSQLRQQREIRDRLRVLLTQIEAMTPEITSHYWRVGIKTTHQ